MNSMRCSIWRRSASASCARCRRRRLVPEGARQVVLASANPGKQRELAALLAAHGIDLVLQTALGIASIAETGTTFEANALLKARHAAHASALPAPTTVENTGAETSPPIYFPALLPP